MTPPYNGNERRSSDIDPRAFGALEAKVDQLEKAVEQQSEKIDQLLELANRGRGAFWAGISLAGMVGSLVTWIFERGWR